MKIAIKRLLRAYHKNKQVLKEKRWGTEFLKVIIHSVTRSMEFNATKLQIQYLSLNVTKILL